MTILVASDSFKDGCTSIEACEAIAKGLRDTAARVEVLQCPISDGGEGTVDILERHLGGERVTVSVASPLFRKIASTYLRINNDTAYIEMAQASGLELLEPHERNPGNTSTFGTGEMIVHAISQGCSDIILAVGGSATNDLGMGLASAVGYQFLDRSGNCLAPIGNNMQNVSKIDSSNVADLLSEVSFRVITDVINPLFGENGAAHIFAAQKGADEESVVALDNGLRHLHGIIKRDLEVDLSDLAGAGAAGGLGGGSVAFLGAELYSGFDTISQLINLEQKIRQADIIITGEGSLDAQTAQGKVISGISQLAAKYNKDVVTFCGKSSLQDSSLIGVKEIIVISKPDQELSAALSSTKVNLEKKAAQWMTSQLLD